MGFWTLFEVASMPVLQVLLISCLGAFMATQYFNLLPLHARRSLNKIVFAVFTPSLVFANLAKTVTLQDIISWWFMPVNIGLTFLIGSVLGWILVKLFKPEPYLEGIIVATCCAGNLGNLLLIIVSAICNESGSPFGDHNTCRTAGLSYASFSMALGSLYIWTYAFQLVKSSETKFRQLQPAENVSKAPNNELDNTPESSLLKAQDEAANIAIVVASTKSMQDAEYQSETGKRDGKGKLSFRAKIIALLHQILEELFAPPTIAAIAGFIFGAVTFLRNLIIGDDAPLRVIQDSVKLLGDGTIPSITLILGGNLTQGLRSSKLKPSIIIGVVCVRFVLSPAIGMWIVKIAGDVGFVPLDPLFRYVLMVQYTLPPAMNISTMTQLYDVGQDECSVLFLWTYLFSAVALTAWSTCFLWLWA